TPRVISEAGATARIGALAASFDARHVGFVTDATILELGLAEATLEGLRAAGCAVTVVSDIVPDPPDTLVLSAAERLADCDVIVSVGGGSSLDVAKLVAVLNAGDQSLGEMYGVEQVRGTRLPLILAPTTAGTGSEVTPISIITTGEAQKMGVVSPQLLPDIAVLDADLTLGLPRAVTAATGVDAMVHAIEAYTSKHRKNPLSDALAREALRLLGANIERVCETPGDREARQAMLLGSCLAGMAFANAPVAAVHALAYPLGGHFHVPHGLSNCLVLPHVLAFNAPVAAGAYAELADILFPGGRGLAEEFADLAPRIGLVTRLQDVGVGHNHLPMLAEDAMKQTRLLVNNPREVTYDDALAIYSAAL
ncbi:MAG: iron-containing alcohol dehydrogenase, partial [Pseudomonadota bacterium]